VTVSVRNADAHAECATLCADEVIEPEASRSGEIFIAAHAAGSERLLRAIGRVQAGYGAAESLGAGKHER
jgi:hypothetical protein